MQADDEVSRVLLATDGDFNVGVSDPEGLSAYVARKRDRQGTYLSVLGFAAATLTMPRCRRWRRERQRAGGLHRHAVGSPQGAGRPADGALFPIADDVKVQVEWNPAAVAEIPADRL